MKPAENRDPALDVIRCAACFGVVAVHFLLKSGFYGEPVAGGRMIAMVFYRAAFMYCVPLFMILSGYLLCRKKLEWGFYKRIGKVLFVYLAASLFCLYGYPALYALLRGPLGLPDPVPSPAGVKDAVLQILGFTAAPYAWYVEMYLGLFLFVPFLNILYSHVPTKRGKALLLLVGVVVSVLPSVVNVYSFEGPGWWLRPTVTDAKGELYGLSKLIPAWWTGIYPLTCYFIGCWLREYGLRLRSRVNALGIVLTVAVSGAYSLWRSAGIKFVSGAWTGWNSPFSIVLAALIFTFFLNLDYSRTPGAVKRVFAWISELSLGAYLVSWVFDQLFYPVLARRQPVVFRRLDACVLIVPLVFVCSLLVSWVIQWLYRLWRWFCGRLRKQ